MTVRHLKQPLEGAVFQHQERWRVVQDLRAIIIPHRGEGAGGARCHGHGGEKQREAVLPCLATTQAKVFATPPQTHTKSQNNQRGKQHTLPQNIG